MVARRQARRPRRATAEPTIPALEGTADVAVAPKSTGKKSAPKPKSPPKPRVRRKVAKVLPRMFAQWAVCDNGMKHVAVFEYRDRVEADAKLADLLGRKAGGYFLVLVKEPRAAGAAPAA